MVRPDKYKPEVLNKKEIVDMQYAELLGLLQPDAEKLKQLLMEPHETPDMYFGRVAYFFIREIVLFCMTTNNDALKLKGLTFLAGLSVPPKTAIDISLRRSPADTMDEEELIDKMVDRLMESPYARKRLEDKLGKKGEDDG